jgi:aryl-alcohol dehydrogenase-like predicted oxidoreductase
MNYRPLGRTGWQIAEVSFGAWAIGGSWGTPDDEASMAALHAALDEGINFFDTADVYGDGHSERLLARLRRQRTEPFYVATKAGRRLSPHVADGYTYDHLAAFVDRSRANLDVDTLDLVQLHCPPTDVYYRPEVFDALERLRDEGRLAHYGVSVERVEEALKALEYPGVQSVQIIFNVFRQRPAERFLAEAATRQVGVLARLPLSSGMLTGKLSRASTFAADDHRAFNRNGEQFDKGETFSGLDYQLQLELVDEVRRLLPGGATLAQWAMRWILMFDGVTCAIPGGRSASQVRENAAAAALPPLARETMAAVQALYDARVRPHVHQRW